MGGELASMPNEMAPSNFQAPMSIKEQQTCVSDFVLPMLWDFVFLVTKTQKRKKKMMNDFEI